MLHKDPRKLSFIEYAGVFALMQINNGCSFDEFSIDSGYHDYLNDVKWETSELFYKDFWKTYDKYTKEHK